MLSLMNAMREMERLRRDIDGAFDNCGVSRWTFPFSRISFLPALGARAYPLLNIAEDADAIHVEALAPGVDPESLKVTVAGGQLTLAGEKKGLDDGVKPEDYHRNERSAGKFVRMIELPAEVEADKVEAIYKSGLLRIKLPKAETAKPKQITVNVN